MAKGGGSVGAFEQRAQAIESERAASGTQQRRLVIHQ
jgi:hypothetical protein